MPRIPEEVINEIRQKARIEDVISQYIEVIRKGNSYVAVCPFHDDHDPSLHISPGKQIFKCFVCNTAGDVFSFVQKYEGITYLQAIKKVAELIGYKYDFGSELQAPVFTETPVHKVMREATIYCQHELNSEAGQAAKNYLLNRGLTQQQLDRFQFGYNPPRNAMYNFLSRKGYQDRDIIAANVGRLTERGVMDVFYDRITIPIHDRDGHPIGFTARTMDPNADSKYINTTDTPVYHKSDVLFNYHRAVSQIRKDKLAILAEGPMDVMAFDEAGMTNAVCSLGTSCTKEQLQLLKRLTNNLLIAYDGDKAGQNATYRGGQLAYSMGFRVTVINNDTDLDPDELVHQQGAQRLKDMVEKPKSWMEFVFDYFRRQHDLNNYTSKKEFAQKIMAEINKLTDSFDKDNYIDRLSQLTGFASGTLRENLGNTIEIQQPARPAEEKPYRRPERKKMQDGVTIAERTILKQMLASKKMADLYKSELNYLRSKENNTLALYILDYYSQHDDLQVSEFVGQLENEALKSLTVDIEEDEMLSEELNEQAFLDATRKIKKSILSEKYDQLKKSIKDTSGEKRKELLNEMTSLNQRIRQLDRNQEGD